MRTNSSRNPICFHIIAYSLSSITPVKALRCVAASPDKNRARPISLFSLSLSQVPSITGSLHHRFHDRVQRPIVPHGSKIFSLCAWNVGDQVVYRDTKSKATRLCGPSRRQYCLVCDRVPSLSSRPAFIRAQRLSTLQYEAAHCWIGLLCLVPVLCVPVTAF